VLAHAPGDTGLRPALAKAAEETGGIASAADAYNAVLRRDTANQETQTAPARIQLDKKLLEVNSIFPAHTGVEDR
jgi:hypothetical protein